MLKSACPAHRHTNAGGTSRRRRWLVGILACMLAAAVALAGCTPEAQSTPLPSPASTLPLQTAPAPTPTPRPATPRPTATPEPTATSTPELLPLPKEPISVGNLTRFAEVARLGKGVPSDSAWSPDGKSVAVASSLGIYLYDPETLAPMQLLGAGIPVIHVGFIQDGAALFAVGRGQSLTIWDVGSGQATYRAAFVPEGAVFAGAVTQDGQMIALASGAGNVYLGDISAAEPRALPKLDNYTADSMAFSPDGRILAVASGIHVVLWDTAARQVLQTLEGHERDIPALVWSPDGSLLATASRDATVRVWRADDGSLVTTLVGHEQDVLGVAFSPDGARLVTGSRDDTIRIWDLAGGTELATLQTGPGQAGLVALSPDGTALVSLGDRSALISFWDVAGGTLAGRITDHNGPLTSMALSNDGTRVAAGDKFGTISVWELPSGRLVHQMTGHEGWVSRLAISPDGRWLASLAYDSTARLWDFARGQELRVLLGKRESTYLQDAAFSPDSKHLIVAGAVRDDGVLWRWELPGAGETEEEAIWAVFKGGGQEVARYSPDGTQIATNGAGTSLRIIDAESAEQIRVFEGLPVQSVSLAFSRDGTLAAGDYSYAIGLWDSATGRVIDRLSAPIHAPGGPDLPMVTIASLAFSPDGTLLAVGSDAAYFWVFELGKADPVIEQPVAGNSPGTTVAFSTDGTLLVTAGVDGVVRLWGIAP